MRKPSLILVIGLAFFPTLGRAYEGYSGYDGYSGYGKKFVFSVDLMGGTCFFGVPQGAQAPTAVQAGGGLTIGMFAKNKYFFGISSEYQLINQLSTVTQAVGNIRGSRFVPVSPSLGVRLSRFLLKSDIEFTGDYKLSNPSSEGYTISYSSPLGIRIALLYMGRKLWLGPYYETVRFSTQQAGPNTTSLSQAQTLSQAGFQVSYRF